MSWMRGVGQRLLEIVRPARFEADLDEELRDHFDRELERQLETGASIDVARRNARLRVGSLDAARDHVRDGWAGRLLGDVMRDVRMALRSMRRNPGFTAPVVISLALGIAGTTSIFSVVDAVLIRALPFPQSDRLHIVRVWWNDFSATLSPADFLALREQSRGVADVGAYFFPDDGFAMATAEGPQVVDGGYISDELPRVLGITLLLGRGFSQNRSASELLISETLWRERFGGRTDAIGRSLTIDGDAHTVVGVLPEGFNLPGRHGEAIWVRPRLNQPTRRGPFYITAIARLAPGVSREQAEARLTAAVMPVMRQQYAITNQWRYGLQSLKEVLIGNVRETLLLTFAAVSMVLLIAIANVANLLLARGTVRSRELAVRASIGAGRGRLARQLLTEAALLGLAGGGLGLVFAVWFVQVARHTATTVMPAIADVHVNAAMILAGIGTGILAGLAAGVLPVLRLPWTTLGDWLRDGGRTAGQSLQHGRARQMLVIAEIALTLTVLTGATLLVKSLLNLQRVDPGFRSDGILSFLLALPNQPYEKPERLSPFVSVLHTRLRALPGVQAVGMAGVLPLTTDSWLNNYHIEGPVPDTAAAHGIAEWNVVDEDYFKVLGIRLVRGRLFDATDRMETARTAIVNETFAHRHFPKGDTVGKRLKGGDWDAAGPWTTIVGVVADVPYERGLWGGAGETVYETMAANLWMRSSYVLIKTRGEPSLLVPAIKRIVSSLDGRVPLRDVTTMTDRVQRATAAARFRGLLFSVLGGLALVLALTGIYGVMAYHVNQRRRETAIRRALGAQASQVVRATLGVGLRLAVGGIAVGIIGALIATRSLSTVLYRVEPNDPGVMMGIATVLAAAAALASAIPAVRAARVDPATILRDE
jgi:putative ABC transport system permease protein